MVPTIDNNNNNMNTDNIPKEDYDNNEINNLIAEEEKEKKKEINAKDVERNGKRTGLKTSLRLASEWRNSYAEEFEDGTFLINGRRSNGVRRKYSDSHLIVPDEELETKHLVKYILTQTSVKKSIKKFGSEVVEAIIKEWKQMDEKNVFVPKLVSELSEEDNVRALRMIMFIKRKRRGRIKARR